MERLDDATRQLLIEDLARARTGFGLADSFTGEATAKSPTCGDEVTVRVSVADGVLTELSWTGHGCTVSGASVSALAALVPMRVDRFRELTATFIDSVAPGGEPSEELGDAEAFAGIGRFPLRARCASLGWLATLDAIA